MHTNQVSLFWAASAMLLASERVAHIDYISMTCPTNGKFIFRSPPLSYTANIYYLPFTLAVWLCSIALVILTITVIYIIHKNSREHRLNMEQFREQLSDFILLGILSVCQMGTNIDFKRISGRIAIVRHKKLSRK